MKISVTRTGGFAGLTEQLVALDTGHLDPSAAQQVEQMVQQIRFFELPSQIPSDTISADMFRYEITVTEAGRQHSVGFLADDSSATASLRALVDALTHIG